MATVDDVGRAREKATIAIMAREVFGIGQARCEYCDAPLVGFNEKHADGCKYPPERAAQMRGVTVEELIAMHGAGIANAARPVEDE